MERPPPSRRPEKAMRVPFALIGRRVTRVSLDHQIHLLLGGHPPRFERETIADLTIGSPFGFRDRTGRWHEFTLDEGPDSTYAPLLDVFGRAVSDVQVRGLGQLYITFDDGAALRVDPDPAYESWELDGDGVDEVLVGPGGHAEWDPPARPL